MSKDSKRKKIIMTLRSFVCHRNKRMDKEKYNSAVEPAFAEEMLKCAFVIHQP